MEESADYSSARAIERHQLRESRTAPNAQAANPNEMRKLRTAPNAQAAKAPPMHESPKYLPKYELSKPFPNKE